MAGSIFFITPIGSEGSEQRLRADEIQEILDPIATELDLKVVRADALTDPGRITTQIVRAIADASVVVADLTGDNPNVMYELGVADSLGKPAVIITDDPSGLPFDRATERAFKLSSMHFKEVATFGAKIREAMGLALSSEVADNPVTAAAGAVALADRAPQDPVAEELQSLRSEMERFRLTINRLLHPSSGWAGRSITRRDSESEDEIEPTEDALEEELMRLKYRGLDWDK